MSKTMKFVGAAALLLAPASIMAQRLQADYIKWPESSSFAGYVKNWVPGTPIFEDENFFISRVKPHPLISRNQALQIYPELNDATDKKLLWWVPIGNENLDGVKTNALPNGIFDSEVFSMWSYVTHYGNWTSPHGWVPGAFADVAHKNGVAVTGVASIPNASLSGGWLSCITDQGSLDVEKAGKFLLYHGVNGLGYNSEYSTSSSVQAGLRNFHIALNKYMADKDPLFEIVAYDGTSDAGSIAFSEHLCSTNQNNFGAAGAEAANLFLNYNWNRDSYISESEQYCKNLGRNMLDLYAGMNMQGGCKSDTEWMRHQTTNYSIGLWGAHDFNYLWAPRSQRGTSAEAKQATYLLLQEWWFSNGLRNPAARMQVVRKGSLSSDNKFFGISRFMTARSPLGWDLTDEPFITYFNLGNGTYFNLEGERRHNTEWYNIGVQDYLPTWRFWWADTFLGNKPENIPASGLDASFTWDDAYFGGSSLRISGSAKDEYLHLFRTNFKLERGDVITVRYKLLSGKADMNLVLSVNGAEGKPIREKESCILLKAGEDVDGTAWIEKKISIIGPLTNQFNVNPLAMIALHFSDAENLNLLLGEVSITRGTTATPAAPVVKAPKVLAYNHNGVDAKLIFEMANNKPAGEPCYNADVNTSMFRLWTQQKGEEPEFNGVTTSWAAIFFASPMKAGGDKSIRFGVQAVSLDMKNASEISWTDYVDAGDYDLSHEIEINKNTIKPGEPFEISYVDPLHEATAWEITDEAGKSVASANGTSIACEGLDELGNYSVTVDKGGANEKVYPNYFMITAWDKGALPQILSLAVNGSEDEDVTISDPADIALSYTGRRADGKSSQALRINEHFVGGNLSAMGVDARSSFGFGGWIKFDTPAATSRLIAVENRSGTWPHNNWGWLWSSLSADGTWDIVLRIASPANDPDAIHYEFAEKIPFNTWFHLAFSFEYNENNIRVRTYFNGKELTPSRIYMKRTELTSDNPDDWWHSSQSYYISTNDWISFGGGAGSEPNYNNGAIDELVLWKGAITEADVTDAMKGFEGREIPANVNCYWSFEEKAGEEHTFLSKGALKDAAVSCFEPVSTGVEGAGKQTPTVPIYSSGCPTLEQSGYIVTTIPTWSGSGVTMTDAKGNDTAGSAKAAVRPGRDYSITLTLENSLGKDVKLYPVLSVGTDAISDVEASADIDAYTVDDAVIVEFAESGNYTVAVFDIAGKCVAQRSANVADNGRLFVNVNASGVFLVRIAEGANVVRTVKLIKR